MTIDDLITAVNVTLDMAPLSACATVDTDGDGRVTVDEIIAAVNAALNGCG